MKHLLITLISAVLVFTEVLPILRTTESGFLLVFMILIEQNINRSFTR